jgi:cytochrome c oxidase subunit I
MSASIASDALALEEPRGLSAWLTTTDHKRIGVLYIVTALVFFIVAVVFAMLMRTQLMMPNMKLLTPEQYNQIFSMHGTTMIFLFGVPMLLGLANYLVPLQIGAHDMVFPRMNMLSYWAFLFGGLLIYSSFLVGGALDTGWFSYAPLSEKVFSPHDGVTIWTLSLVLLGISSLLGSFNFIITMLKMRTPGMTFFRMPLFSIATFFNSFLLIFAIPSLTADVAMLYLDRQHGTVFFKAAAGGDPVVWQHLFWFFGHPEVYILILPAFGIMSEVVPVFSRKRLFGRSTMIIMLAAIGVLGFGVWGHHMFTVGMPKSANAAFAAVTMVIAIPTGVKIFNWLATMWGGSLKFRTPMLFACGLIALFTVGGISGVMQAVVPFDWQVEDTFFIVGHLHNVLFPGTVFAVFAGIYYWFPKVTGRFLSDRLGKWQFWVLTIGFLLTFMPMYALGLMGMPRRVYTYASNLGWNGLNFVSTIGAFIIATAIIIFFVNVVRSLRSGEEAPNDPWDAWTLEWATTSPPPPTNFVDELPLVTSDRPLWDLKQSALAIAGDRAVAQEAGAGSGGPPPRAVAGPHGPGTVTWTYAPLIVGIGLLLIMIGLLGVPAFAVGGGVAVVGAMVFWMWSEWPETETPGVSNERFSTIGAGMIVFLASECIFFGSLIFTYLHLRLHLGQWPPDGFARLKAGYPTFNTILLVSSGVVLGWARRAFGRGERRLFQFGVALTFVMGAGFLGGQAWEYTHVGFRLSSGLMGATFFTLTGFHGAHVLGGLVMLLYMFFRTVRDKSYGLGTSDKGTRGFVEAGTYYWHFVDAVWVLLFVVLYLL